jgi:hypothetical protein
MARASKSCGKQGITVYLLLQNRLVAHVRAFLKQKYNIELANIVVEQPPKIEMGEFALPVSFELARTLRKAPRKIADEIVAEITLPEGFAKFEVAGAGYINARLDRSAAAEVVANEAAAFTAKLDYLTFGSRGKVLVEHTSINPNKAAHIGHLRNSILGDTLVRLLRAAGYAVDVQNYIDNTGVQVADVVVGFERIAKKSRAEIEALIAGSEGMAGNTLPPAAGAQAGNASLPAAGAGAHSTSRSACRAPAALSACRMDTTSRALAPMPCSPLTNCSTVAPSVSSMRLMGPSLAFTAVCGTTVVSPFLLSGLG